VTRHTKEFRLHGQDGFAATELVLGIGVLLLPVALVVLAIPTWAERQTTARAIVREVGRFVAASGVCDVSGAEAITATMSGNLGLPPGGARVELTCRSGALLEPGSDLTVMVTIRMPAVHLIGVGDVGEWEWTARHRQPVDLYVASG
jgi:hypothetical protein